MDQSQIDPALLAEIIRNADTGENEVLARQMQMSDALRAQAMRPSAGSVAGILSKGLQGYAAGMGQQQQNEQQRVLAAQQAANRQRLLNAYMQSRGLSPGLMGNTVSQSPSPIPGLDL